MGPAGQLGNAFAAKPVDNIVTRGRDWTALYRAGGIAALAAAILFRRNIGAEVSLFTRAEAIPQTVAGWFTLLQESPFVGLAFLAIFDVANYILVGLMFLALAAALWPGHKAVTVMALASGLMGIAVSFSANISLSMLSLSQQYAAATTEVQRAGLQAAGQAVLAFHNPSALYQGTGAYLSWLFVAVAGVLFSVAMLQGQVFDRATVLVGLLASACDLAYCLTLAFAPGLRVFLVATAGAFWMIWHLMVGLRLLRLTRG
jgi:hypothetical protein